jgi:hypothetical protein
MVCRGPLLRHEAPASTIAPWQRAQPPQHLDILTKALPSHNTFMFHIHRNSVTQRHKQPHRAAAAPRGAAASLLIHHSSLAHR